MTSDNIKSAVMLAGIGAAAYVAWKSYQGAAAIGDTFAGLTAWALPKTPEVHAANYAEALHEGQAEAAANPWTSLFTANPNNYAPADLVPAGYTVNQYGDLVQIGSAGDLAYSGAGISAASNADAEKVASYSWWDSLGNYTQPPQKGVTGSW